MKEISAFETFYHLSNILGKYECYFHPLRSTDYDPTLLVFVIPWFKKEQELFFKTKMLDELFQFPTCFIEEIFFNHKEEEFVIHFRLKTW